MLKTSIAISLLAGLSSLAGFASNLVIAHVFGAGADVDAYLAAASVPTVISALLGSMLNFSLVPYLLNLRSDPAVATAFTRSMFSWVVGFCFVFAVTGAVVSGSVLEMLSPEARDSHEQVAIVAWCAGAALILVNFVGCLLYARESYYVVTCVSMFPSLGIIVATMAWSTGGILMVPVGMLIGTLAALLFLLSRTPELFRSVSSSSGAELRRYVAGIPAVIFAMSCFSSYALIDAYWASRLGEGSLSYLGFSQRILIAVGNLAVVGPSAIVLPLMARSAPDSRSPIESLLAVASGTTLVAGGICAALASLANPAIALIFQHGSFDAVATNGVAGVLAIMLCGAVPMLGAVILIKGMFQLRLHQEAALIGAGWSVMYFLLSGWLSSGGVKGIAIAYVISWWIAYAAGLGILLRGDGIRSGASRIASLVFPIVAAGAVTVAVINASSAGFNLHALTGNWIQDGLEITFLAALGLAAYAACCRLMLRWLRWACALACATR